MNKHLENYLYEKYPKIFAEKDMSAAESCMYWGITCGDGWFFLLDAMCGKIQWRLDRPEFKPANFWNRFKFAVSKILPSKFRYKIKVRYEAFPSSIPQVVAEQVKEKFGTLCFYYRGGDDYIHGVISFAEYLSGRICENCGAMNEHVGSTTKGWIQTLCACCQPNDQEEKRDRGWKHGNPDIAQLYQTIYLEKN